MEQAGGTLDGLSPMRREFSLRSGHARARSDTDPPPPAMLGVQTAVYDLGGVGGGGGARPYAGPEAGSSFRTSVGSCSTSTSNSSQVVNRCLHAKHRRRRRISVAPRSRVSRTQAKLPPHRGQTI